MPQLCDKLGNSFTVRLVAAVEVELFDDLFGWNELWGRWLSQQMNVPVVWLALRLCKRKNSAQQVFVCPPKCCLQQSIRLCIQDWLSVRMEFM